jgi:hypothetical protein
MYRQFSVCPIRPDFFKSSDVIFWMVDRVQRTVHVLPLDDANVHCRLLCYEGIIKWVQVF